MTRKEDTKYIEEWCKEENVQIILRETIGNKWIVWLIPDYSSSMALMECITSISIINK